jgi:hypothetical protein
MFFCNNQLQRNPAPKTKTYAPDDPRPKPSIVENTFKKSAFESLSFAY